MKNHLKKRENNINYECFFTSEEAVCSEYSDNPHGVNYELRLSLLEFLDTESENTKRARDLIKNYFYLSL